MSLRAPQRPQASPAGRVRLLGLDLARGLAVLGMLAVHIGPTSGGDALSRVYALPHGRASVLFVLLAGVSVTLLARSRSAPRPRAQLLWRALLLLPAGLALQSLDHGASVILAQYAVLFAVATLLVGARDRLLLGVVAVSATLGPVAHWLGQATAPAVFARTPMEVSDGPVAVGVGLLATGGFPIMVWAAPFALGLWLGRRPLGEPGVQRLLVVGGLGATALAWAVSAGVLALTGPPTSAADPLMLLSRGAHSQMPAWLLMTTGTAVLLVGAALMVARRVPRSSWPVAAVGQLALTLYVAHLIALHLAPELLISDEVGRALQVLAVLALLAVAAATLWRSRWRYGPLEAVLRWPASRARQKAATRAQSEVRAELEALQAVTVGSSANPPRDARHEHR